VTEGDGIARLLRAIGERMPREEVEAVYAFPAVRREGREYGVAVVSRLGPGDRRRVYRARYVVQLAGQERGRAELLIEETAEAPAALIPEVIEGVRRRADEAGEAELVDLSEWKAGDDGASRRE
jgi:pyruvate/2-oxoglutarate dehydrogenase complex dihydrolipoamide acyltransferase (E2) component